MIDLTEKRIMIIDAAGGEGGYSIRANAIAPGSINTPAWKQRVERNPAIIEKIASPSPLERMVKPGEVANAAVFLTSELASGINGATLPVDGGLAAGDLSFIQ